MKIFGNSLSISKSAHTSRIFRALPLQVKLKGLDLQFHKAILESAGNEVNLSLNSAKKCSTDVSQIRRKFADLEIMATSST